MVQLYTHKHINGLIQDVLSFSSTGSQSNTYKSHTDPKTLQQHNSIFKMKGWIYWSMSLQSRYKLWSRSNTKIQFMSKTRVFNKRMQKYATQILHNVKKGMILLGKFILIYSCFHSFSYSYHALWYFWYIIVYVTACFFVLSKLCGYLTTITSSNITHTGPIQRSAFMEVQFTNSINNGQGALEKTKTVQLADIEKNLLPLG